MMALTKHRHDRNLQLSGESLWHPFAHADGNRNGNAYCYRGAQAYSFTAAASHAAASALRPAFNGRSFGDSRSLASPRSLSQSALSSKHWPRRHR